MNLVNYTISRDIKVYDYVRLLEGVTKDDLSICSIDINKLRAQNFGDFKKMIHRVRMVTHESIHLYGQPYAWPKYYFVKVHPNGESYFRPNHILKTIQR